MTPQISNLILDAHGNRNQGGGLEDFSDNSNDGTLVSAPPQIETPFGSAHDYDGSADSTTFGNIGSNIKTVSLLAKLDSLTNYLIDFDGTDSIDVSAGTVRANSIANAHIYVDGDLATAVQLGVFHHIVVTTDTALNGSAFTLANIGANFGDGVFLRLKAWSVELDGDEVLQDFLAMERLTARG